MRCTTSDSGNRVESICTASSAGRSGASSRSESSLSRRFCSASTCSTGFSWPFWNSSSKRRPARTFGSAKRKILSSASGNTTVPMSRPSRMAPSLAASASFRCSPSSAPRTTGCAETRLAASEFSGVRIASETSSPSRKTWFFSSLILKATDNPSTTRCRPASSSSPTPPRRAFSATHR